MKIKASVIIEIMGRPASHVEEAMSKLVETFEKEPGIKVLKKDIKKAKQVQDKDLFTTFSEIEFEAENIKNLFMTVFRYMPSHIDIISPEEIKIKNHELGEFASNLVRILHKYDELVKRAVVERNILAEQLRKQGKTPVTDNLESCLAKQAKNSEKKVKKARKKTDKSKKARKKSKSR